MVNSISPAPGIRAAEALPGKQVAAVQPLKAVDGNPPANVELRYQLFLPQAYSAAGKEWPLLLFLHGAGERGTDLELVKIHGPPKIVASKPDFPMIVASPDRFAAAARSKTPRN